MAQPSLPANLFFDHAFGQDPYPPYAALRAKGPIHPIEFPKGVPAFLVVDHECGRAALSDPRLSKDPTHSAVPVRAEEYFGGTMLGLDPPDHTRLRGLVAKAFTPRRVEALRPRVRRIADELLDDIAGRNGTDLIDAFAFPLPIIVICELLGVPAADRAAFREWTAILTVPIASREMAARRRAAAIAFNDYLLGIFAERRQQPRDDLISALLAARDGAARLSERELLNTITLLLVAGHETTVNLIGNGVLALLSAPAQRKLLADDPELLPGAIEELLRFDGPVERASQRIALEDMEIAGTKIPKGAWVHVSIGAADRDPAAFADPDALDLTRTEGRHMAFGHGPHYCLGAPLARLEGQVAIGTLLARFPGLALATARDQLAWKRTGSIVRGLAALPVRLR
jgi:cytochrome P450